MGIVMLLMFRLRMCLCSAGSGVKRVEVDLSALMMRLFDLIHVVIVLR